MSIHHLQLWVPDLARAEHSWGWLLTQLGYVPFRRWEHGCVWRDGIDGDPGSGTGIVIEQSPDMVPGMLHSRLRPGMNHVAFSVASTEALAEMVEGAAGNGWTRLGDEPRHPLSSELAVAYLEDTDGFEVELIAPAAT